MTPTPRLRLITSRDLDELPQLARIPAAERNVMRLVSHVLPFRTNNYVIDELIDWSDVPDDPIFQLTFPQPGMLRPDLLRTIGHADAAGRTALTAAVAEAHRALNPHPEGQTSHNVPIFEGAPVEGVQHKYAQTCLVFPAAGQTCHAYCTYCFRWAQFVGLPDLKFSTDRQFRFLDYIAAHREVSDVLLTGGDPMVMRAEVLARYVEPLLRPEFAHIQTIRIGTKMLAYWPYRVLSDPDADDLLRLLSRVVAAGKHLAIMAHFSHWRELTTPAAERATRRLRDIGATIRTQAPLIRHVNDDAVAWSSMWREQVRLGLVPYYMFVERDTGANHHFEVPLARALDIYRSAIAAGSGLARSARGPVMSTFSGKVMVQGVTEINGRRVFVLSFLQARNHEWCGRPFFADYDDSATWLDDLRPAFGAPESFFATADPTSPDEQLNATDLAAAH